MHMIFQVYHLWQEIKYVDMYNIEIHTVGIQLCWCHRFVGIFSKVDCTPIKCVVTVIRQEHDKDRIN